MRWAEITIASAFAGCFALAAVQHARTTSATYDEAAHLPAGYSCLAWRDFRLSPEHPPLVREWAALPLLAAHVWPATIEPTAETLVTTPPTLRGLQLAWTRSLVDQNASFEFGHYLLYGVRDEVLLRLGVDDPIGVPPTTVLRKDAFYNDADRLLLLGRLQIVLLGLLLAMLVFSWARELHGPAGALLALALYCFDPNFVAHGSLVTTDVGVSLFIFGSVYFLWRTCRHLDARNLAMTGLFVALTIATKLSAIMLAPIFALLALVRIVSDERWTSVDRATAAGRALAFLKIASSVVVIAYAGLWAAYGFRYSAVRDPSQAASAESTLGFGDPAPLGWPRELGFLPMDAEVHRAAAVKALAAAREWPEGIPEDEERAAMRTTPLRPSGRLILLAARWRLLPEAYLFGLAYAQRKSLFRPSFFLGRYSNTGFRSFFPLSFLLKTPVVTLLLIGAALISTLRRREQSWLDVAFLAIPVTVYFAASIESHLDIGHRHLLPMYPFLFVLTGTLAHPWKRLAAGRRAATAVAVVATIAVSSVVVFAPPWRPSVVYPHYLAYFNELAGGPRLGYTRFVDSSLDWGQDLKHLKSWLDEKGISEPIGLSYFGMADPRYYGIRHVNLPGAYGFEPADPSPTLPVPGWLAISATNLQGPYYTPEYRESLWRILRNQRLADVIGYTIFVYRLEAQPHPAESPYPADSWSRAAPRNASAR